MKCFSDVVFSAVQRSALYGASLLVRAPERAEWSSEWFSELWHVRGTYLRIDETISILSQGEITLFCLGAFTDALCVRELSTKSSARRPHMNGSAAQTLLRLAEILLLCYLKTSLF